jgi:hypothetical protein
MKYNLNNYVSINIIYNLIFYEVLATLIDISLVYLLVY